LNPPNPPLATPLVKEQVPLLSRTYLSRRRHQ